MGKRVSRRAFLRSAGAATALAAGGTVLASPTHSEPAAPAAPASTDLREGGDLQRRWLSLPGSRLVINPYDFYSSLSPREYSSAPSLPLHVGYYASDSAFELRELLTVYRSPAGRRGGLSTAWEDNFDSLSEEWQPEPGLDAQTAGGILELTVNGEANAWGALSRWVEVDLDESPYLQISVPRAEGAWSLKVNDGTQAVDTALQGDTRQVGTFTYELPQRTGWRGTRRFLLKIFAVGVGRPVLFERVRIVGLTERRVGADSLRTSWLPHKLPFAAEYEDGARVGGHDYLYGPETVVRRLSSGNLAGKDSHFTLAGRYRGRSLWDRERRVLIVGTEHYSYAIALSVPPAADAGFYPTILEFLAGESPQQEAGAEGIWSLDVDLSESPLWVAVGFATTDEGPRVAVERAGTPTRRGDWAERLDERRRFWDHFLARRVPLPHNFELTGVPDSGVGPEEVRADYYKAWVFLAASVLPVMPETGYPYPQFPTGKPSLWAFGAPGSSPSASWESLLAMQLYAYVDPELSWAALRGMMSLVDEEGVLGGESLPSRKAQTAMVLFELTDDRDSLREIYPALGRYLRWRMENPRWIFKEHDDPAEKDAEFVVSALTDMGYARDIAAVLGMPDESRLWEARRAELFRDYLQWFWETPTSEPVQYYFTDTGERNRGNTLWVATGLHLDLWEANSPHLESLRRRFAADYDPRGTFAGFNLPKYPDLSFSAYGLLERGMLEEAEVLANAAVRDVTRANTFAEQYDVGDFPAPQGVRPSLFGVCAIVDLVWIKNGYRMDRGWPHLVRMTEGDGGLSGLRVRGRELTLRLEPSAGTVGLSGSLINKSADCRRVEAPLGETVPLPEGCTTLGGEAR